MGVRGMRKMEGPGGKVRFLSFGFEVRLELRFRSRLKLDVSACCGFRGEVMIGQGESWFRFRMGILMGRESEIS